MGFPGLAWVVDLRDKLSRFLGGWVVSSGRFDADGFDSEGAGSLQGASLAFRSE